MKQLLMDIHLVFSSQNTARGIFIELVLPKKNNNNYMVFCISSDDNCICLKLIQIHVLWK